MAHTSHQMLETREELANKCVAGELLCELKESV